MNRLLLSTTAKKILFFTSFTVRTESTSLTHIRWQHLNFIGDVFSNNKIILGAQTLHFQQMLPSCFLLSIEEKKNNAAQKFLVLQVSFLLTQATPAVEVLSRMCWCHLTSFTLINETQRPWLVRTELQCLSHRVPPNASGRSLFLSAPSLALHEDSL